MSLATSEVGWEAWFLHWLSASLLLTEDWGLKSYFEQNLSSPILLLFLFQCHIFFGKTIFLQMFQASDLFVVSQSHAVVTVPKVLLWVMIHKSDSFLHFITVSSSLSFSSEGQLLAWVFWNNFWEQHTLILIFAQSWVLLFNSEVSWVFHNRDLFLFLFFIASFELVD